MNTATFRAILNLSANTNGFNNPINNSLDSAAQRLDKFSANAKDLGKDLMAGGGAIAAPFVLGAKAAIDYESAFAGVAKTWRGDKGELAALSDDIMAMSTSSQNIDTAERLSDIAASANQLGINGRQNVVGFTRVIADLGATTDLGEDAAAQLAQFGNITGMAQDKYDELGSTIVELGNNMATTESKIVDFAMRVAGAGAQVDIPQSKILGLAAGLSSVGIEAEMGGTAISKTLIELSNRAKTGGAGLAEVAKIAGMTSAQFKKSFEEDAAGATVTFIEGLGKVKKAGGNVFAVLEQLGMDEVRLRDTLLRASGAGDLLRRSLTLSADAWEENHALTKEAETRYKTTASQLKQFHNNVRALGIEVGNALVPAIQAMTTGLRDATEWIRNTAKEHPTLTQAVVIGTAALGAFLTVAGAVSYTVGVMTKAFGMAKVALTFLTARTTWATAAKWLLIAAENAWVAVQVVAAVVAVSVGAAVGGLVAGIRWLANVTKIHTALQWVWNAAMAANPVGAVVVAVVALGAAIAALVIYWEDAVKWFKEAAWPLKIVVGIIALLNWQIVAVAAVIRFFIDNWDGMVKGIEDGANWIATAFSDVYNTAVSIFNGIVDFIAGIPGKVWESGKKIVMSLVDGMLSVATAPIDFISGLAEDVMSFLPFSPAKQGPFRKIMDVQIVESIASTMKPQPMVSAMQQAAGQTMAVANGSAPSSPLSSPVAARNGIGGASGATFVFSPKVTIEGHADAEQVEAMLLKMGPKFMAMIKAAQANEIRTGWGS